MRSKRLKKRKLNPPTIRDGGPSIKDITHFQWFLTWLPLSILVHIWLTVRVDTNFEYDTECFSKNSAPNICLRFININICNLHLYLLYYYIMILLKDNLFIMKTSNAIWLFLHKIVKNTTPSHCPPNAPFRVLDVR